MTPRPVTDTDLATAQAVLSAASLRDSRITRPDDPGAAAVAAALAEDLAGINPHAALAAVKTHYRESTERIMPGHIWAIVRRASNGPGDKPTTEALHSAEHGPTDHRVVDHDDFRALPAADVATAPKTGNEAVEAALRKVAAKRALPPETSRPTGFEPRRLRRTHGRAVRSVLPSAPPNTVPCFVPCIRDVQAPPGWDPSNPDSPPLWCPEHDPNRGGPS